MTNMPTSVQTGSFLTLHYRLGGPAGDIINTFQDKPATFSIGSGALSPAMEECLIGLPEGAHQTFELPAGSAFGEHNPAMQQWVAAKLLKELGDPHEVYQVGDVVQFPTPDGQASYAGVVVQIGQGANGADDALLFDFNHPLAGKPVTFEVQVISVL